MVPITFHPLTSTKLYHFPSIFDWAVKRLEQDSQSDIETNRVIKNNFRRNLKKLNSDLERLLKLCVNGTITEADYLTNKERVEKEIVGVEDKLKNFGEELESTLKLTERYIDFLSKVKEAFMNGGLEKKKKILRCFGDNFILHNNKLEIEFYPWVQAIKKDQPQTSNIGGWSGKAKFEAISTQTRADSEKFLLWYSGAISNRELLDLLDEV